MLTSTADLWKENRKKKQLENEVYLLKESFYRVSKRLILLENFIKSKFVEEFPPSSHEIVVGNYPLGVHQPSSQIATSSKSWRKPGPASKSKKSGMGPANPPPGPSIERQPAESLQDPLSQAEDILRNGEDNTKEEDADDSEWNANFICESPIPIQEVIQVQSEYIHDETTSSQSLALMEMGNEEPIQDGSDEDVKVGIKIEIDEVTDDAAQKWLVGGDDDDHSSDSDSIIIELVPEIGEKKRIRWRENSSPKAKKILAERPKTKRVWTPLSCHICHRVFAGLKNGHALKTHMDIHTAERKYKCKLCDKSYKQARPLRTHIDRVHRKEQNLIHPCQFCDKKFITRKERDCHERVHTGESPYACDMCDYRCKQENNLVRHKKTHIKDKFHLCPDCGKSFTSEFNLRNHEKSMHNPDKYGPDGKKEKKLSCELCSSTFFDHVGLQRHLRRAHAIDIRMKRPTHTKVSLPINDKDETAMAVESIQSSSSNSN